MKMQNVQLSKLVTLCYKRERPKIPEEGEEGTHFQYDGHSRSQTMKFHFSFPHHPNNLSYYEHYSQVTSLCNLLSFIYLGDVSDNEIFNSYEHVKIVEFSQHFFSVKTAFGVLRRLKSVMEVRFFLDPNNISLSEADKDMEFSEIKFQFGQQAKPSNVRILRIMVAEIVKLDSGIKETKTRFHYILEFAWSHFPNLIAVYITMDNRHGYIYRPRNTTLLFAKMIPKLPEHEFSHVSILGDKFTYGPKVPPDLSTLPIVSSTAVSSSSTHPNGAQSTSPPVVPSSSSAAFMPVSVSEIKQEITSSRPFIYAKEGDQVPVIELSSDEEGYFSPVGKKPKKSKPDKRSALDSIQSSYCNGRQDDSLNEFEPQRMLDMIRLGQNPVRNREQPETTSRQDRVDEQEGLDAGVYYGRRSSLNSTEFVEGVHYERRPKYNYRYP